MQFEELDKRINEAASQHQPAFDTKAWEKMNQLLDKELPQKKERKRRFFFILLFLLPLAAGSIFILSNQSSKKPLTTLQHINKAKAFEKSVTPIAPLQRETGLTKPAENNNEPIQNAAILKENNRNLTLYTSSQNGVAKQAYTKRDNKNATGYVSIITEPGSVTTIISTNNAVSKSSVNGSVNTSNDSIQREPVNSTGSIETTKKPESINKDSALRSSEIKNRGNKSSRFSHWALTFSTGPDISEANSNSLGKTTMTLGAGISYSISKKFTLRSGFYTSKKIYSASAGSYHPPAGYWTYYYDLKKIDANCTVYEIPLTISYNFAQAKKHTWFSSAGLSSYLMKKETYDYTYKDYAGQLQNKSWTLENKNKHYFSVLDLSAGYKYSISKKVSLMAEPYLKLPLSGVGFGKIKLSSGGVLFTVNISAFGKH